MASAANPTEMVADPVDVDLSDGRIMREKLDMEALLFCSEARRTWQKSLPGLERRQILLRIGPFRVCSLLSPV